MKISTILTQLLVIACLGATVSGQVIAYEPFAGMPIGSGVMNSGASAMGWTNAGWAGGSDPRFQTIDSAPDLTYQITGGAFMNGSDRAIQLSTNPEPISYLLLCTRSLPPQNSTVYISFLARVSAIGTGSDVIDVRFNDGSTLLARLAFTPDQQQRYVSLSLPTDGSGGSGGGSSYTGPLYISQTYLVVARITRGSSNTLSLSAWVNPPADFPTSGGLSMSKTVSSSRNFNSIGFGITSTDNGGPTTTMAFDEMRIGYTWGDVVLPSPPPPTVPNLEIKAAVKISWHSVVGKTYQVQSSYDLATWFDFGSQISGNGTIKTVFDAADEDAKKFYRVQIK